MHLPTYSKSPSESTIEQLSNHHLLNLFDPCSSWFFVPTKREEKLLGYDASLQEYKALIIQYKAFHPNTKKTGGSININTAQHKQLLANFPNCGIPYAFYAFSVIPDYKMLSSYYSSKSGCCNFSDNMVFIDIHDIPVGTKSFNNASLLSTKHYDLKTLATMCHACNIGIRNNVFSDLRIGDNEEINNLSILLAYVPHKS